MSQTVLITGANRGIGLELVKQYAKASWQVIACCRHPQQALELQRFAQQDPLIAIHQLDVCDSKQAELLTHELGNHAIDVFINNAGILNRKDERFGQLNVQEMEEVYRVNAIAPVKLVECFLPQIEKSQRRQIIQISSALSSISHNHSADYYAYRASKVAVNMLMKNLSIELAERGIKVLVLDPGWVKTDMGGPDADLDVETSVSGIRRVIDDHQQESGVFYRYNDEIMSW